MGKNNLPLGRYGEELALKYLKSQGFKIVQKNFRSRLGEIDIVACKAQTFVFVEVKTRFSGEFGSPEEAITPWKLRSLVRAVHFYQLLHEELLNNFSLQIDAIVIELAPTGEVKRLEHLRNISS